MTPWALTVDCRDAGLLGRFWAQALGYVAAPPPAGWSSWPDWFDHFQVPVDERNELSALVDPAGVGPSVSFLSVPEGKTAKNRLHLDVKVSGGRQVDWQERWPVVLAAVERLTAAGATVLAQVDHHGRGDHMVMQDPEGNEFCVI